MFFLCAGVGGAVLVGGAGCSSRASFESSTAVASGSRLGNGPAGAANNKERREIQQEILRRQEEERGRQERERLEIERQREYDQKLRKYE